MDYMIKARLSFLFSLIIICCFAFYIQQHLFISWDISALLHSTEKLLQGGNYIDDFFIPNPPMIMYLYIPPVVLAKLLHVDVIIIFRLYILTLILISYAVCYRLISRIFLKEDIVQRYIFATALAAVFLILPIYELGQRDHLLVVMAMPYLLAMVCRLVAKPVNCYLALAIGIFAGFGIAIKPQFLVFPLIMELYFAYQQRSWRAWLRPEILGIVTVQVLYGLCLLITRQDYVTVMMPYLVKNYYGTSYITWANFLFNDVILFIYTALLIYIFLNKINKYKKLSGVLFFALMSFAITYLTQGFLYFYHMVPAMSLAMLMLVQLYTNIFIQKNLTTSDYKTLVVPAVCMLLLQTLLFNVRFSIVFMDPAWFFVFFTLFFLITFMIFKVTKNIFITFVVTSVIAFSVHLFFPVSRMNNIPYFIEIFLTLCMFLLLIRAYFLKQSSVVFQSVFTALLGILLFASPTWMEFTVYGLGVRYKQYTLNKLISFIHTLPPHESIYMFSTGIHYTYPLASYTDIVVAQRFDALWMVRGLLKQMVNQESPQVMENIRHNTSKIFILNMIVDDLQKHKPDLIFVEKDYPGQKGLSFNFLEYFLKNKAFSQIWQNYRYLTTVEQPGTFKLDVYQLKPV